MLTQRNIARITEEMGCHLFDTPKVHSRPIISHGKGVYIYDTNGNEYIDFSSGHMVANIGHADERVINAMVEQAGKIAYCSRLETVNEPLIRLCNRISDLAPEPLDRIEFANSGTEANEAIIKLAYRYHLAKGNPQKMMVISRWHSYHGMTLASLSLTGHPARRDVFTPLLFQWPKIQPPLCYHCSYGKSYPGCDLECAYALEEVINLVGADNISCFICEPISGSPSGVIVPSPEYFPILRDICHKYDILFALDEVLTGFGRTGRWFGIEHWPGVCPDIIAFGKGCAGGYTPISGIIVNERISTLLREENAAFQHGHTMSGNPLSCAVALSVIDIMENDKLIERAEVLGDYLQKQAHKVFEKHPIVGEVRGKGLLLGVEIVKDRETREPFDPALQIATQIKTKAQEKGIFITTGMGFVGGIKGDAIAVAPPLIISEKEIDTAIAGLDAAIGETEAMFLK